jgi:hypothetical protein
MGNLFGSKPKMPAAARVQEPQPVRIDQTEADKKMIYAEMAKRKRATMLNQIQTTANTKRQTLGAM